MANTRDAEGFDRVQWDEESHVAVVGPRDGTDASTFADAGLTGSPDVLLGYGSVQGAELVPDRETIVVTSGETQPAS
jgi:hypothetical protein